MKIELDIKNTENLVNLSQSDIQKIKNIVEALVTTGGLTGVKGGQTIIHFDSLGEFQRIQVSYFPWVNRKH
jgi:hypothetical protein